MDFARQLGDSESTLPIYEEGLTESLPIGPAELTLFTVSSEIDLLTVSNARFPRKTAIAGSSHHPLGR